MKTLRNYPLSCFATAVLIGTLGGILALDYIFPEEPDEFAPRYSGMTVEAAVPAMELPERTGLSYSERVHNAQIIGKLQEQRIQALTRDAPLPEWVKNQFVAFETAEGKGLDFDRSVAWGIGWYHGKQFDWFAYTSPDGWIRVNMSLPISKKDVDEINTGGRLMVRGVHEKDLVGTAAHIALRNNGTTWLQESCVKDFPMQKSSVCDTAGALEKYLLAATDKVMPDRLLFFTRGYFPY